MGPDRTGITPLVVTSLVVGGMAIITHITAVAYPQWDGIDAQWRPVPHAPIALPIQAHSSLWDFTVVTDKSNKFFYHLQHYRDTAWKKPIILMATTGIGVGLVGEGLIILTALLRKCTKNVVVHVCVKMITTTFLLCVSFQSLMGAILYMYSYTKIQALKDLNLDWHLPYKQHTLRAGFYLECAASGLFILTTLLFILEGMISNRQDTSSINLTLNEESVSSTYSK